MLIVIFSFLRSHWQTTLIASAAFSVFATLSWQHFEIKHLSSQLSLCHAESITLENSNKALVASLQRQNQAVETLQAVEAHKQALADHALAAARIRAKAREQTANRIFSETPSREDCVTLQKILNDFVAGAGFKAPLQKD
jgi:hypothetical protein